MDALQLFVGGHENHNFSLLPHDLPVHRGFDGCIFDLSVRSTEATQASCHIDHPSNLFTVLSSILIVVIYKFHHVIYAISNCQRLNC